MKLRNSFSRIAPVGVLALSVMVAAMPGSASAAVVGPGQSICMTFGGIANDFAVVNLTPVQASGPGNGVLMPSRMFTNPPLAANVNYDVGTVDPNVAIAQIDQQKRACFANSQHSSTHLVADHMGTLKRTSFRLASSSGAAKRVLDTRKTKAIRPNGHKCFAVPGKAGDFAVVNLTPVLASAAGHGQLVASNLKDNPPLATNVNFGPGTVDPNVAISQIGSDNKVCFVNSNTATVHLIADSMGAIRNNAYVAARRDGAPQRRLDTRSNRIVPAGGTRCFKVKGGPGDYAVVNLTPVLARAAGNGQLVSSDVKNNPPLASNVNFGPGTVDPNVAITQIGGDGRVCFVNSRHGAVHLVADHLGTIKNWAYAPAQPNGASLRAYDSRKLDDVTFLYSTGPHPIDPSLIYLACIETSGNLREHNLGIGGIEPGQQARVTAFDDLNPNTGDGSAVQVVGPPDQYGYVYWVTSEPKTNPAVWSQRIRIDTYVDDAARRSSVFVNVSAQCNELD